MNSVQSIFALCLNDKINVIELDINFSLNCLENYFAFEYCVYFILTEMQ